MSLLRSTCSVLLIYPDLTLVVVVVVAAAWEWKRCSGIQFLHHNKTFDQDTKAILLLSSNLMRLIKLIDWITDYCSHRPIYLSVCILETHFRFQVPTTTTTTRLTGCAALCSLTVRDVKPAWRSRWLRHRSLCDFQTFILTCLHVLCSFSRVEAMKARLSGPVRVWCLWCGALRGCSITGLAAARLALMRHPQPRS